MPGIRQSADDRAPDPAGTPGDCRSPLHRGERDANGAAESLPDATGARQSSVRRAGPELATSVAALESAIAGEPAVLLVGGEAGVGKTRLVEEAAERARGRGARVLTGSCIELGGEGVPLSPLVDALRTLMRVMDPDELDGFLGPARPDLARLLPELDPEAAHAPAPAGESGSARLLELVFGVVQRLAADRTLMFVIEDLQWADRSTLDLISLLVRSLRGVRVLLVLTFRSDEIHRSHPLRPLIAAWERVRSVRRLELPRFTREEATRQLEAILGSPPPRPMLGPLYERSEGNAFLIEEILAAMQAGAGPEELPVTLRDVLLARAERLSEPALRLLRVAATAGTSVSDRLLARGRGARRGQPRCGARRGHRTSAAGGRRHRSRVPVPPRAHPRRDLRRHDAA